MRSANGSNGPSRKAWRLSSTGPLPVPRRVLAKLSEPNYPSFWHEEHLLSWLQGRALDVCASGRGDSQGVWRKLPSGARQSRLVRALGLSLQKNLCVGPISARGGGHIRLVRCFPFSEARPLRSPSGIDERDSDLHTNPGTD